MGLWGSKKIESKELDDQSDRMGCRGKEESKVDSYVSGFLEDMRG